MGFQQEMARGELVLDAAKAKALARPHSFALATPITRIVTFHSGSLSALVASLPALLALRESFPGAHISSFARAPHVGLLAHFRACDEAHARPGGGVAGQAALMARLHASDFDLAVAFSPGANVMLLLWSTRASQRAGFVPSPFDAFLTHRVARRGPLRARDGLDLVTQIGASSRGSRVGDALEVPQETFEMLRARLPFEFGQFVLAPFDSDLPRSSKAGGAGWTATLSQMRAHWPVVIAAPRAGSWKETAATPAPHGAFVWPAPDALTLLALIRTARAVVGPGGAASELALLDGRRVVRASPEEAATEALRMLGL
jgi:hypothetical protein